MRLTFLATSIFMLSVSASAVTYADGASLWGNFNQSTPSAAPTNNNSAAQNPAPIIKTPPPVIQTPSKIKGTKVITQPAPASTSGGVPVSNSLTDIDAVQVVPTDATQAPQQTVCTVLLQQPTLMSDPDFATKIKDQLIAQAKVIDPEYEFLITSPATANNLYTKYRDLYLKTYCTNK